MFYLEASFVAIDAFCQQVISDIEKLLEAVLN